MAIYFVIGKPGMGDRPMATRQAELAARAPEDLSPAEALSRLEALAQENPEDAEPRYLIGIVLAQQGRDDEAVRAYQSALRRNDRHVEALIGLADSLIRLSGGEVSPDIAQILGRAYALDPRQVRAAFLVGVSAWQMDQKGQARAIWDETAASLPEGSPAAAQFEQMVARFLAAEGADSAAVSQQP
ncbi:MAG: tetratricopeptide repeat protein [Hyphomonadaceae bacterium]|nr:tetratricopeptide repeat protein [Hyphomonadaceae bacterium]